MRSRRPALLALLGAAGACARSHATLPVEPGVTFALHPQGAGFVIDRMRDGTTGMLAAPGWFRLPNAPALVLRSEGEVRAALWLVGRTRVLVRAESSTIAPRIGEVLSSWDGGAVRLALWAGDGRTLRTDTFQREDEGTGPALLDREARTASIRGTYRAIVRDAAGVAVGWMRARIGASASGARAYDAVFPPGVEDGLAAAASVALDAEVGWIEDHAASARGSEQEQRGDHDAEGHTRGEHADGDLRDAVETAPDGSRGAARHALHPVRVEDLDVLLVRRRQRIDPLLDVRRERRDGLLGRLIGGERGQRELEEEHQRRRGEPHGHGA